MQKTRTFLLLGVMIIVPAISLCELTGTQIMQKVEDQQSFASQLSKTKMTLIDKRGKTRERELVRYSKDYSGAQGIDAKTLILFEYPADIRGTGLLLWSYQDVEKDDDRWLYLPALKRIRRIVGESKNDYFMGTDFTYDDMGDRKVEEDTHTLLGQEEIDGQLCYKVESIPVDEEDMYSRKISWILPDKWLMTRVEFYEKDKELLKILTASQHSEVDGIWTSFYLHMENLKENHQTVIEVSETQFNLDLKDQTFTSTALQRGMIR